MINKDIIYVTKPALPPIEEFIPMLQEIWKSKTLTNCGPFHEEFEKKLCKFLGVKYVSLFTNATIALVTALQALKIQGEVITTPFSFVATANVLKWNGFEPVFVDIDPMTLNLDPAKVEKAITSSTVAIMPVHCYGIPCNVDEIKFIADKYNLKIIYDAAHAFGVESKGESILNKGDLSVVSFHATKVFNTFEGGAIICSDERIKKNLDNLRNFGFISEVEVIAPGINGKMSEFNAALGLLQLKYVKDYLYKRKIISQIYIDNLLDVKGIRCILSDNVETNNSYFPILVNSDYRMSRDNLYKKLKEIGVYSRRYFYPLISEYAIYKNNKSKAKTNLINAHIIAEQILCLPIYPDLKKSEIVRICEFIEGKK
jgi:dTDP-4-amino-4,6-dideoxygalactose transaminase